MRTRSRATVVVVTAAFAAAVVAVVAGACQRPCESSQNCKRTCECVDGQTAVRNNCTMAFRCEGDTQTCEADFDGLSCDDICSQYAARGECGFERCAADAECTKRITCPVLDADGNATGLNRDCTLEFICDQDQKLCDAASTLPLAQMCLLPQCQG